MIFRLAWFKSFYRCPIHPADNSSHSRRWMAFADQWITSHSFHLLYNILIQCRRSAYFYYWLFIGTSALKSRISAAQLFTYQDPKVPTWGLITQLTQQPKTLFPCTNHWHSCQTHLDLVTNRGERGHYSLLANYRLTFYMLIWQHCRRHTSRGTNRRTISLR